MNKITVFCPASIANLSCGFDLLGVALNHVGDEMIVEKTKSKGVVIDQITGYDLPLNPEQNVAGKAAQAMLNDIDAQEGVKITIHKKIHPGSGIGSSSASASGVVYAINKLFDNNWTDDELVHFAMIGEYVASGSYHADNVAPALLGGIVFIPNYEPFKMVHLPVPQDLYFAVITPQVEVKTSEARKVLRDEVPLKEAITQAGNLGGLIAGLYTSDYALIRSSIKDVLVEPQRRHLIPCFDAIKKLGIENGALEVGISGSGPSIFAMCKGEATAQKVLSAIQQPLLDKKIDFKGFISEVNTEGVSQL